jgi:thymidylate kinase
MLKNGSAKRFPNVFQSVQFLNKLLFQTFLSFNTTGKYDFVILDRWKLSGEVYGSVEGVNPLLLRTYNWILFDPNVTFVLTGQPWRTSTDGRDVYEKDGILQEKVRALYQDISRSLESKNQGVFSIEYTVETPAQIQKKIVETLKRAKQTFF